MKAIITVGISASGKSTFAEELMAKEPWVCIERDKIRAKILYKKGIVGYTNMWSVWKFKWENEVTKDADELLRAAVQTKSDIIISNTHLNYDSTQALKKKLEDFGYEVEIKIFDIDYEVALKRNLGRANSVGHEVLYKQYRQYKENWCKVQKATINPSLPPAIIVDVDGTLAHMKGRSPFEWSRVGEDTVDQIVASIINHFSEKYTIIVMSGRDGVCYPETKKWLIDNGIYHDYLIMRAPDDQRRDSIIKSELYFGHIDGIYNVVAVIDDRPQVCRMWRDLGLNIIQVGDPYLEF